jgi:carboxyvinyl-carboxyphosphonate phosphorylmutase
MREDAVMSRWRKRRERLRAVIEGDACVHPASVHDPISVRVAEDLGFEMGMFAGSVASLTVLGAPDLILLTLTEFASQAYRISRASDLPVLADADHGYGNALNVMRTVEELEAAGIAGLTIEDTALPQAFAGGGKSALISAEEGVGKIAAAVDARSDPNLVIAGRTSAAALTDMADAIARAKAYEGAGADAIFMLGIKTRADLEAVSAEINRPLIIAGTGPDFLSRQTGRAYLPAGSPALRRRDPGHLYHPEDAERGHAAGRARQSCTQGPDGGGITRARLCRSDQTLSGMKWHFSVHDPVLPQHGPLTSPPVLPQHGPLTSPM